MEATTVIKKPFITEKATFTADAFNRYAFQVDRSADKGQIKRAIEELYNVRVVSVATQIRKGHWRRYRYGFVKSPKTKRAIIKVHPDDKIELF